MRIRFSFLFLILACISCSVATGQWVHQTTFPGSGRLMPFCFVVNDRAYIGSGFDSAAQGTVDNYEYDHSSNRWSVKRMPPFVPRMGAFSFAVGQYGYVGSGSTNGGAVVLNDFWRYDPARDTWTQMASFPGAGRIEAATFVVNGKGYVVSGVRSAGNPQDCWEYDPAANRWTQKSSPPEGFTSGYVTAFADGVHGYCGIGGGNSNCRNDFWRYDPATDQWTQMASLPAPLQSFAVAGIDPASGNALVGLGGCSTASSTDFRMYDPSANLWQSLAGYSFPVPLVNSRSFVVGGGLYVGTGGRGQGMENRIFKYVRQDVCVRPPAGMTGWWPMDETSVSPGSPVEDLTGNGTAYTPITFANGGTVVGSVVSAVGKVGKGYEFSGNGSDYVRIPDQADLGLGTGDFTLDAWVKPDNINGVRVIADKRADLIYTRTKGWSFFLYSGALSIQIGDQPGSYSNFIAPATTRLTAGQWYHVAATVDRDNPQGGRLYVNGTLVHTFNPTARQGSLNVVEPMVIGRSLVDFGSINAGFDGVIDEFEVFKRALGADEIAALFNAGSAGKCKKNADSCCVEKEAIGTGWNHAAGATNGIGEQNSFWQIVADPKPNTAEPRPANTVLPYSQAWRNPLPGSQWISAATGTQYEYAAGVYEFRSCYCFCSRPKGVRVRLVLDMRADDRAEVFVNGSSASILSTPSGYSFASVTPSHFEGFIDQYLDSSATDFCLTVRLVNDGGPMGLNVGGYIELVDPSGRPYAGIRKVVCCSRNAAVNGVKFWDKDCDGIRDAGEPGLPGWTIRAEGSGGSFQGITAADGSYQINLPSGSYTLTEDQKPGWTQCAPVSPANQVTVAGGAAATVNFGNNRRPPDRCFLADSLRAACRFDSATGIQYYDLTMLLRTLLSCNNAPQYGQVIAALSSTGALTVTPGGMFPVSTSPLQQTFSLSGSGATPGALVKLVVKVCCASQEPEYQEYCCTDTIALRLPDQPCAPQGCFEIVDDSVHCVVGPDGVRQWTYCFRVRNHSFFPASYLTLAGAGVSFSPSTIALGTLAPGSVSGMYCVAVNASGPGYYTLSGVLRNARRTLRCERDFRLELPDCPVVSCCPGFASLDVSLRPWTSGGSVLLGNVGLTGRVTAVGKDECRRMSKVEVTIENASMNSSPVSAYFVPSLLPQEIGGLGAGTVTTLPYGKRVVWGAMTPRIVSGATNLRLVFPPLSGVRDTIRFCLRYRFTDECCNTCDTLICYSLPRRGPIFRWPPIRGNENWYQENEKEEGGAELQGAPALGGIVTSDSAYMNITLPEIPGGRYVGMMLAPIDSGVTLRDVTPTRDDLLFLTPEGVSVAEFDLPGNTDLTLGLKYDDFGQRTSIRHAISIFYTLDSAPGERQEFGGEITLYAPGSEGGDIVEPAGGNVENARTFALHLRNANSSGQPIARLALRVRGSQKILAVGPAANDTTALLLFRRLDEEGVRAATEARGNEALIPVQGTAAPIYLTIVGGGDTIEVDFVTLNEAGEVISSGTVSLATSSINIREGEGDAGGMLLQSYPNPTDGSATIEFLIPRAGRRVTLVVTDQNGHEVSRLVDGAMVAAGLHAVWFDGSNLPSGTYYCTLQTAEGTETRQLHLVR